MVDFNLQDGEPTINDDVSCLLQQIDILFDTTPGDLIGDLTYGTDYERFLYDLRLREDVLQQQMMTDICSIDLLGWVPEVQVHLMMGTERDIALIQVDLTKDGDKRTKIYRIE